MADRSNIHAVAFAEKTEPNPGALRAPERTEPPRSPAPSAAEANRLAAIVEATPDFVAISAADGRLLYMNRAGRRMLGIADDADLAPYAHATLCPGWVFERTQREWMPIALRDGSVSGEGALLALDGREIPVSFVMLVHRDARGEVESMSTMARDITERKRDEQALRRREQEFRTFADNSPSLLARFDRQHRHIFVNRRVETLTGRSADSYLGKTNREMGVPEEFATAGEERLRHVFETGTPATMDFVFPSPTGLRAFQSWFGPEFGPSGSVETALCITRDMTEQRQLENELRQRMEELAGRDRRKNEFLATLAHELRNPLAPVRNGLQLLRRADGNRALTERVLGMMERQVAHMVRLIDDLLDLSRITRGKLQLRRERVELAGVVQSAIEASRPAIEAAGHELTVSAPTGPIHLDADPTRLAQVLSNLLTNAAKYTDPGGRIRLSIERHGGEVEIAVRDNGIGVAPEHLPRVFEMFSQVSPALERSQGGLGIGLSLVRGLVELHGGSVAAKSDGPGTGSEFSIRLPLVEDRKEAAIIHEVERSEGSSPPGRKVLVVDDNVDAADSLAAFLEISGYAADVARDGAEALLLAEMRRPEVVLLDIGLPKKNGYEVARHIRAEAWGADMVLIALTGWGQHEDKQRAAEAGFDFHLTKPADPQAVLKLLATLDEPDGDRVSSATEARL